MLALLESLNKFVDEHRGCQGSLTLDMPPPSGDGRYVIRVRCDCDTTFEARVTLEDPPGREAYNRVMASLN
jgi:hypothetical protein